MRENKMIATAGADRLQEGMRKAFGKPIGVAARVDIGSVILDVLIKAENLDKAKAALKAATTKLPLKYKIVVTPLEKKMKRKQLFRLTVRIDTERVFNLIEEKHPTRVILERPRRPPQADHGPHAGRRAEVRRRVRARRRHLLRDMRHRGQRGGEARRQPRPAHRAQRLGPERRRLHVPGRCEGRRQVRLRRPKVDSFALEIQEDWARHVQPAPWTSSSR